MTRSTERGFGPLAVRRSAAWLWVLLGGAIVLVSLLGGPGAKAEGIDFDALPPGQVVSTIPPASFTHSESGIDPVVATGLVTTSTAHYLGAAYRLGPTNDEQSLFLPGESLRLTLDEPVYAISLAVLSTAGTPAGAFELATSNESVQSGARPDQLLGSDEVYRLSLASGTPFSFVELRSSFADGLFAFHVDDIVVPEPASGMMLTAGIGLLSMLAGRMRRP